jgi:hypothetical protein
LEIANALKEKNLEQGFNKMTKLLNTLDIATFLKLVPAFLATAQWFLTASKNKVTSVKTFND